MPSIAKQNARGVHFMSVLDNANSELFENSNDVVKEIFVALGPARRHKRYTCTTTFAVLDVGADAAIWISMSHDLEHCGLLKWEKRPRALLAACLDYEQYVVPIANQPTVGQIYAAIKGRGLQYYRYPSLYSGSRFWMLTFLKSLISDGIMLNRDGPNIDKEWPRDVESMCKRVYTNYKTPEMVIGPIHEGTWVSKEEWDAMWANSNADLGVSATDYEDSDDYETDVVTEDDGEDEVVEDDAMDVDEPE